MLSSNQLLSPVPVPLIALAIRSGASSDKLIGQPKWLIRNLKHSQVGRAREKSAWKSTGKCQVMFFAFTNKSRTTNTNDNSRTVVDATLDSDGKEISYCVCIRVKSIDNPKYKLLKNCRRTSSRETNDPRLHREGLHSSMLWK